MSNLCNTITVLENIHYFLLSFLSEKLCIDYQNGLLWEFMRPKKWSYKFPVKDQNLFMYSPLFPY